MWELNSVNLVFGFQSRVTHGGWGEQSIKVQMTVTVSAVLFRTLRRCGANNKEARMRLAPWTLARLDNIQGWLQDIECYTEVPWHQARAWPQKLWGMLQGRGMTEMCCQSHAWWVNGSLIWMCVSDTNRWAQACCHSLLYVSGSNLTKSMKRTIITRPVMQIILILQFLLERLGCEVLDYNSYLSHKISFSSEH